MGKRKIEGQVTLSGMVSPDARPSRKVRSRWVEPDPVAAAGDGVPATGTMTTDLLPASVRQVCRDCGVKLVACVEQGTETTFTVEGRKADVLAVVLYLKEKRTLRGKADVTL